MTVIDQLMATDTPFLTDGGFETSLFFLDGFEAPEFAAIVLLDDPKARAAKARYFDRFLTMAAEAGTGFVLDTSSWRGAVHWGEKLGQTEGDMLRLNRDAVRFAHEIKDRWADRVGPIVVNGVVGPAGDGYAPDAELTAAESYSKHAPQIGIFAEEGVDMVSAITMTHVGEAIGIANAATDHGLPVVISFTVETDGRLPTGETLAEAIAAVDYATGGAPIYYMVNCAHPDHFSEWLTKGGDWLARIGGLRANASRMSHAELDNAEELDDGDPVEFGHLHADLATALPGLKVIGGCCGTDHRHIGCVSGHLHHHMAA